MQNQKVENDNSNKIVVRLVGKGYGIKKKSEVKNCTIKNIILETDLLSGDIKGLTIKDKTYFVGTEDENDEKYEIGGFSKLNQYSHNIDFPQNLLCDENYRIFQSICVNKDFCFFDATINLNNFNNTLSQVGNFEIIKDKKLIKQIKNLLKKKGEKDKNDELMSNAGNGLGYSLNFKNLETGTEWKRLLKTMYSDRLSPIAQTLYLTCLLFKNDDFNNIRREVIDEYASNFTEQEREEGLKELIDHGYLKNSKMRYMVDKKMTSSKDIKIPERNCRFTYDSNIIHKTNVSSMAIGYYIVCIESCELNNRGFVKKENIRKYYGWSSFQTDECFKELEKLGYIQTIKVKDEITKEKLTIYLFRKSLDQDFCDVEKESPNYKIVKK